MNFEQQLYLLSTQFAKDYPHNKYPELMYKQNRPYTCLLIETHENFLICIPFRSNIKHDNAFLFTNTMRSQKARSGLDYSKIVIIQNLNYIDSTSHPIVDQDEYAEMVQNLSKIVKDANQYVDTYIEHITGQHLIHPRQYVRKYQYSTLPYFLDILKS